MPCGYSSSSDTSKEEFNNWEYVVIVGQLSKIGSSGNAEVVVKPSCR